MRKNHMMAIICRGSYIHFLSNSDFCEDVIQSRNKGNEPIQSNSTSCPKHQTGKGHLQLARPKNKNSASETPRGQLFPNRWPPGYPKWTVSQRQTESKRTLTIRINHNRNIALERSVINYWAALTGFTLQLPHPRFCCGSYTHKISVRVTDLYSPMNQNSEHINQFINEMKQDEYSTANRSGDGTG